MNCPERRPPGDSSSQIVRLARADSLQTPGRKDRRHGNPDEHLRQDKLTGGSPGTIGRPAAIR
jgi:hypothetical protein